ncbi:MAG: 50S ribosomal protein L23 [Candidatus Omnitrophota bacterium]|nr:50S ribosomal protein L23 [Candidatus Omnitrophota bacterium]
MKRHLYDILRDPVITEKIAAATEKNGKYAFRVHSKATKRDVKAAVEKIFSVHVTRVNTMVQPGKWRRVRFQPGKTPEWKKAIVTLKKGEKIDITA